MSYYVSPRFLNKLAVHITKNYLDLPQVKVPLILGVHGRKGEGKTFQCELVFERMGVEVVYISGGELESPDAGDPARLIRLRYREAAELVRVRGNVAVLMINDLDAGAGRFDRMTQYTVNTQLVNNTLMNIADKPTNVQLPGSYDEKELPRIPIIATGNDFATLYAPLIRDGRMQKFYWEPKHDERIGIVSAMFAQDGLSSADVERLVTRFDNQAIDFFSAVRSQIYDEQITQFIQSVGIENISSNIVNTLQPPRFAKPNFHIDHLISVGETLVQEQEYVRTMGLVNEYNQALTPANKQPTRKAHRNPTVPMPPPINPLSPYRLGKRDAQLADNAPQQANSQTTNRSHQQSPFYTTGLNNTGLNNKGRSTRLSDTDTKRSARPNFNTSRIDTGNLLTEAIQRSLRSIFAQGYRLGIEHVDQRRFRVNSWQGFATLDTADEAEISLKNCLSQFPTHYVRLVSIDRNSKRRMNETIIQRPA